MITILNRTLLAPGRRAEARLWPTDEPRHWVLSWYERVPNLGSAVYKSLTGPSASVLQKKAKRLGFKTVAVGKLDNPIVVRLR